MSKKAQRKYVFKPAIEDAKPEDKGTVVSAQRARWKQANDEPTERMIRMTRFIWMRDLMWDDRHKLHKSTLGQCMSAALVTRASNGVLLVTESGERLLNVRRRKSA